METVERRATAALWSLNGIGPKSLFRLERTFGGLGHLFERPVADWRREVSLTARACESLDAIRSLAEVADGLEKALRRLGQRAVFPGDGDWPPLLAREVAPLLFVVGPGGGAPRRRVAIVGTRHPEPGVCDRIRLLAIELVTSGLVVVSGGAEGIDQAAHSGALRGGGETWAFLGSAIEQMDPAQLVLWKPFLDRGGSFFSQFPPGTRADRSTFRRRNPLISGSSDAVLVARAPKKSGALITAQAAVAQGRPLLVIPGDPWNPASVGTNELLHSGLASVCLGAGDVIAAVGLKGAIAGPSQRTTQREAVSEDAAIVLEALDRHPADVDELVVKCGLESGRLSACLVELQLAGYVVQKAGGRFEKSQ